MPAVQIRDLPQPTYDLLKADAQASGRSINKHTEAILVDYFAAKASASSNANAATQPAAMTAPSNGNPFRMEAPGEIAARAARRAALFSRIDECPVMPLPSGWDPASIVRQMRDQR